VRIGRLDIGEGDASAGRLGRRTGRRRDRNLSTSSPVPSVAKSKNSCVVGSELSPTRSKVYLVNPPATLVCARIWAPSQYTLSESAAGLDIAGDIEAHDVMLSGNVVGILLEEPGAGQPGGE
jgi:hypothetical protein